MHDSTPVGICGFKVPSYADVTIFIKGELRGAASKVEGFKVGRRGAIASVGPSCGLALVEVVERRRCGGASQNCDTEGGGEFHRDSNMASRIMIVQLEDQCDFIQFVEDDAMIEIRIVESINALVL